MNEKSLKKEGQIASAPKVDLHFECNTICRESIMQMPGPDRWITNVGEYQVDA